MRIHSWGGFGSQLFTAYVVLKVQKRYPGRRIKVIVHTSGITRRVSEFDFEILKVEMIQVEDYKARKIERESGRKVWRNFMHVKNGCKKSLRQIVKRLSLIQTADTDDSFNSVSFWTFSLRGHYTRLTIEEPLVQSLYEVVFSSSPKFLVPNQNLVIHYRLGDLLGLDDKRPISFERVEDVLERFKANLGTTVLLSDSSKEVAAKFLETSRILKFSTLLNYDPKTTLKLCIQAQTFLGTSAKLSLWASIFRSVIYQRESFLPLELSWLNFIDNKVTWF
jgi:hypothetical protein